MARGRSRTILVRLGVALSLVLVGAGVWAYWNWPYVLSQYACYQLRSATTEDERRSAADLLVGLGSPGYATLVECIRAGDEATRNAAAGAVDRFLAAQPDGNPHAVLLAGLVVQAFPQADDAGKRSILALLPIIFKRSGNAHATHCREAIAAGLKMVDPDTRVLAIRLALHPDVKMRSDLLPLLHDPEPRIRAAALFGVALATNGEMLIADEDLFPWLHDADEGVRKVCYDALVSRDRSEAEIALGRRLSHPDPAERLMLLLDLRFEDDILDPEPWLERLSRDKEPAIRVGAARVALEVSVDRKERCPNWVARVSDTDPDATVRRIASFFRREILHPAGAVRPAGGP